MNLKKIFQIDEEQLEQECEQIRENVLKSLNVPAKYFSYRHWDDELPVSPNCDICLHKVEGLYGFQCRMSGNSHFILNKGFECPMKNKELKNIWE